MLMEDLNESIFFENVLVRMNQSQTPSCFCHQTWLLKLVSKPQIELLEIASADGVRIPSLEEHIHQHYSCIVSFREMSGPFGFLVDLKTHVLEIVLRYFTLYILHYSAGYSAGFNLLPDAKQLYEQVKSSFNQEGAIYRNSIAVYAHVLQKMLAISFGHLSEKIDLTILSKMGFFCMRVLLSSQVSIGFMNMLMLRLNVNYIQYNPFQYANDIACRNSKLSFLIQYLLKEIRK